jgi:outer membrane receptor for ferric coprogen and ferric-rhodotorulic acid
MRCHFAHGFIHERLCAVLHPARRRSGYVPPRNLNNSAAGGETVLPEIIVQATGEETGVTEDSGSYTTPQMNTATKLPLSIRETPQSVTVITRQRMDDQNMLTVSDAVQSTPGLSVNVWGPGRNTFFARGFEVDNIAYDGLTISLNSFGADLVPADLSLYDRVEIVRGAAGLTQGAGRPGAAINLVRKRPTRDTRFSLNAQSGNWDRYGIGADISSPLNAAGTLRGRAVVNWQDYRSFQDVVSDERKLVYLIAEADIARETLLTVSVSRQESDSTNSWTGLPTALDGGDLKLSRSTYLGSKWEFYDKTSTSAFASLERHFDNRWKVNFSLSHIRAEAERLASRMLFSGNPSNPYNYQPADYFFDDERTNYDLYANGPFRLFGREHELNVGADKRDGEYYGHGGNAASIPISLDDIHNWSHSRFSEPDSFSSWNERIDETQRGVYGAARLNLADPLKLILGARLDWYEVKGEGTTLSYNYAHKVNRNLTRYAGLIYDLDARHSLYASYTDIFKPQTYITDTSGDALDPIVGKNYEVGIKGEYFGGTLNASAALFRINQKNVGVALSDQSLCPSYALANVSCYRAAGMVRSQGFDLEIQGAITPNWQIGAGYTYVDKEIRQDADRASIGTNPDPYLPRRQFKLSTTYHLPGHQWRVGGSAHWQSGIYREANNFHVKQGAYAVANLMLGYRLEKNLDIQLNVNNLFDKTYYRSLGPNIENLRLGGSIYGEPRNFMLTAKYSFF